MLQLGGDVLELAPCSPCWPPPPCDPACTCSCLRPWDGALPGLVGVPLAPPPPLRGCRLAAPLPRPPRPRGGDSASSAGGDTVVGVPPSASPLPAAGGVGVWGVGAAAVPSWMEGKNSEGGAEAPLLGSRSESGGTGGGRGRGSFGCGPPLCVLGCLVALPLALGSVRGALLQCSLASPAQP